MPTVTGLTSARMLNIEANSVVSGAIVGNDLILTRFNAATINAGNVRGPQGVAGPMGEVSLAELSVSIGNLFEFNAAITPTLTGMAIGTGGGAFNSMGYLYMGGTEVGERGFLEVWGTVLFGTSTPTFPTGPTITIPPGFNFLNTSNLRAIGDVYFNDVSNAANNRVGRSYIVTATTVALLISTDAVSKVASLTTTTPFTWASGDSMVYGYKAPVIRV